jgi:ABC-2 type transport system permease protein
MKALYQMTLTELKLSFRNIMYIVFTFIFPPLILLLFGGIYGNEAGNPLYGGHGAMDVLTPAYMGMVLAVTGFMGLPSQLAEYRHNKVLKRFRATPLGKWQIMLPHFIVAAALCLAGTLLLVFLGKIAFDIHFFGSIILFILSYLLCMTSIFSLGFLIAALAPNIRAANSISYLIFFPMLFLSGATMPLEKMPSAVQGISKALPLTHCNDLLKGAWTGAPIRDLAVPLIVLAAVTLIAALISIRAFRWE